MIYSSYIINKNLLGDNLETLTEAELLQEMHFSQKDLQDPSTLDKILKRRNFFDSAVSYTRVLFLALAALGGILTSVKMPKNSYVEKQTGKLGGIAVFSALLLIFMKIGKGLESLPNKWYAKNSKKYEEQLRSTIEKMEKAKESDPKNKDKYDKVIAGCKKVLNIIETKRAEAIKRYEEEQHRANLAEYEEVIEWLRAPSTFGHTGDLGGRFSDFCWKCKFLKIPEKAIYAAAKSEGVMHDIPVYGEYKDHKGRTKEWGENDLTGWVTLHNDDYEKAKKDLGSVLYQVQSDDDYSIWYAPDVNKFFETDADTPYREIKPYSFARNDDLPNNIESILIDADKELGYYLINDCPENVQKKPLPIKF